MLSFLFKLFLLSYVVRWFRTSKNRKGEFTTACQIGIQSVKDLLNALPDLKHQINYQIQSFSTTGSDLTPKKFILTIDIPGFKSTDVNVVVNDDLRSLRVYGKTSGFVAPVPQREVNLEIPIPGDIDLGSLSAFFVDGVCRIEADKKGLGRRIFVNSGNEKEEKDYENVF